MKLYWIVEHRGDGWNDWWDSTCPACARKFEKRDPSRFCPDCGTRTHGCQEVFTALEHDKDKGPVRKKVRRIWEFDSNGRLQESRTEETELEVPDDDPAKVFHRRYNMV